MSVPAISVSDSLNTGAMQKYNDVATWNFRDGKISQELLSDVIIFFILIILKFNLAVTVLGEVRCKSPLWVQKF